MITFGQALSIALLYWFVKTSFSTCYGANFNHPVVAGLFIGILCGDPIKGTMLGGLLQTMNMAPSMVGNTVTMDLQMAAFVTIPLVILTGLDAEAAVAIAVPFTVIGSFLQASQRSFNQVGLNICDKAAERGDTRTYMLTNALFQPICYLVWYMLPMFCALYFGQHAMQAIVNAIPEFLMIAFTTLAKFLPAIGFAMFLRASSRPEWYPLFFLGFYIMWFLGGSISLIGMTVFGGILAFLIVNAKYKA